MFHAIVNEETRYGIKFIPRRNVEKVCKREKELHRNVSNERRKKKGRLTTRLNWLKTAGNM